MGGIHEPHVCRSCPTIGGSVTHRGHPHGPLCDRCWTDTQTLADHDQALTEGADAPPPPAPPLCRDCARPQDRFATGYGHWVLLEPRIPLPVKIVPDGERWFIASDGCAINSGAGLSPDPNCRIRHALVCPVQPRPDHLAAVIGIIWDENRRRHQPPTLMPDAG
nr:DUF6083 domain-containing protein [Streptomyces sabulosicollis]